jgi:Domain of unknown function (DUF4348)
VRRVGKEERVESFFDKILIIFMMKYFIGFLAGVIITSIFFTMKLRQMANNADGIIVEPQQSLETDEGLPADFLSFYQRFHDDSLYQLEHVTFPLQGIPSDADSATIVDGKFRWQKEGWVMHHPIEDAEIQFSRSFKKISDEMVVENIKVAAGQYGMQRRFSKLGDDWYLIYYAAVNRLAVEE